MQQRLIRAAEVLGLLARLALWLAGVGLAAMTLIVAWQVFARYVLNASPSWSEAASILIMSWFILLGAAVGVRENFHMGFDVLLYVLPAGAQPWLRGISDVAVLTFGLGMVVYGMQLTIRTWTATIPVLQLPGGFNYMPLVLGGLLIALFALERLARRMAGMPVDRAHTAADAIASEA